MVASRPIAGRINRCCAPDGGTASRCATPSHASRAVGSRTVSQPPPDRELWTCHLRQPSSLGPPRRESAREARSAP